MTDVVIAVDIGGTKTAVALAGADDVILARDHGPTPASQGPEAVIATVAELARRVLARGGNLRVRGVGIGTAGVVDVSTGTIVSATDTFARWPGTALAAGVREALGDLLPNDAPVHVQNDVDAHAVGEFRHGAAAGAGSALVVAVGTGVGAGLILDGVPQRGAHHVAGEIGHLPVPGARHLLCPCGRLGHLEAIGSGLGLHAHFRSLGGNASVRDAREVAQLAESGHDLARLALTDSATAVGSGLAGAVTLLDPEVVIVTGGVADIGEAWWTPMERAFRSEVIDALAAIPLRPGTLRGDAPLRGASASVWSAIATPFPGAS